MSTGSSAASSTVTSCRRLSARDAVRTFSYGAMRPSRVVGVIQGDGNEVHVVVDYGADIPAVAAEVQRRVADYLQKMADVRPSTVDVVVDDVERP